MEKKIFFISYGGGEFHQNKNRVLDRHIEYAKYFDEIIIIQLTKDKNLKTLVIDNLKVFPVYGFNYFFAFLNFFFTNRLKITKNNLITSKDPFLTGFLGLIIKYIWGAKLHVQNHSSFLNNGNWIAENKVQNSFLNFLSKFILKRADRLRVVNRSEQNKYILDLSIKQELIDFAPVPISKKFKNLMDLELKKTNNVFLTNDLIVLGWAGRFDKVKRVEWLFETYSLLLSKGYKIELRLAGDFEKSRIDLEMLEKKFNVEPKYLGYLTNYKLIEFYSKLHLFLLPSLYEGFGLVALEAQYMTIPVISSNSKGPSEIIINGVTGYICENFQDFMNKILALIENPENYRVLKKNSIKLQNRLNVYFETKGVVDSLNKTFK